MFDGQITFDTPNDDILALHEAIARLEQKDHRKSQIVLLRFFSGLSMEQIAEQLGVSRATVHRDWRFARAWLARELERGDTSR
jgi:RNA polymerase sigma factor (sigma-70 family)